MTKSHGIRISGEGPLCICGKWACDRAIWGEGRHARRGRLDLGWPATILVIGLVWAAVLALAVLTVRGLA